MSETMIDIQHADQTKASVPLSQLARAFDMGLEAPRGQGRPTAPYSQVAWVYVCVDKILKAAGQIGLMLSDADDQIVESGPAYDFLFANPDQPLRRLVETTLGYLALFRECYWVKTADTGAAARAMAVYGPNRLKPVIRRGAVVGYKLHLPDSPAIPLFVEDVIPLIGFNPDVPYHGVGPLVAGQLDISSSYQATLYNEATMANGARIGALVTVPAGVKLSEDEIALFRSQFDARHSGARNAGRTAIVTGGVDVKVLSQTMAELQMIDLRKFDAVSICALFGVPPEIAGLNSEAQYAHGPAAQRFITDTVGPMLSFIADHLNDYVLPALAVKGYKAAAAGRRPPAAKGLHYRQQRLKAAQAGRKLWAWFAVDDHPALQEMLRQRAEKMLLYVDKGVPLNQIIDAGDLPFEHVPWGEHHWISAGMMPAQWVLDGGMEQVTGPSLPEGDGEDEKSDARSQRSEDGSRKSEEFQISNFKFQIENQKADRVWKKYVASWRPLEKEMESAVRTTLRRQKAELIKKLESALKADGEDVVARVVFDLTAENKKIKMIHRTFYTRAAALGAAQVAADAAGLTAEPLKDTVEQVLRRQALRQSLVRSAEKIQAINKTTAARVAQALRDGLAAGEGLPDLRKRLEQDAAFSMQRAKTIARTHVGSAVSAGRHEAAKHVGAELKFWLTSKDDAVRQSHKQAEIDHKDGIGLDEAFKVGGDFLLYPGDPGGSPANVVNCRCMELIKRIGGKTLTLDDYDRTAPMSYDTFKALLKGLDYAG